MFYERLRDAEVDQEQTLARKRERTNLAHAVSVASAELDERERFIVQHRSMAGAEAEYSLAHIGKLFGVSRERARQLETRVKNKLRRRLEALLGPALADAQRRAA